MISTTDDATRRLQPIRLDPLPEEPLVSVLITNYNYAAYVAEAIESVLHQSYAQFEIVVCDDGSTDNSCAVIERYCRRDPRVRLIRKENGGQASATAAACTAAQGEILCLLDADDLFYPAKLEKLVAAFRRQPEAGCCIHRMLPVSMTGEAIAKPIPVTLDHGWVAPQVLHTGLLGCSLSTSGLAFRKQAVGYMFPLPAGFTTRYRNSAPTDMYLLGIARLLAPVVALPDVLVSYRFHGANDASMFRPSAKSLQKIIDHFETVHRLLRDFLAEAYGQEVIRDVHLDDYTPYLEHLLALSILEDNPQQTSTREQILAHLPETRRKRIWRTLLLLPHPLAAQALAIWWGMSPWKRMIRPLWRSFGFD